MGFKPGMEHDPSQTVFIVRIMKPLNGKTVQLKLFNYLGKNKLLYTATRL